MIYLWRVIRFSDYLGCLRVKHLLGSEQSLHVCDQKQYPGVVKGWQFIVEFRVQNLVCPLGVFHLFLDLDKLSFVSVGIILHLLDRVSLLVEIYQLPSPLINLFLKT